MTPPFRTAPFRALLSVSSLALILAAGLAGQAQAQTPSAVVPPEHYTLDARGVDLISGGYTLFTQELSIGGGPGAISYGRLHTRQGWRDPAWGWINCAPTSCTVIVGEYSEVFSGGPGGPFTPTENTGSTLSVDFSGDYTYRTGDGVSFTFSQVGVNSYTPGSMVTQRTDPNGLVTTYNYHTQQLCSFWDEFDNCIAYWEFARMQSYTNNAGYQLHYEYLSDDAEMGNDFFVVDKVTAINLAVDYCAPLAFSCPSLTRTWPSVSYNGTWGSAVTDNLGRTTYYYASGGNIVGVRLPGSTTNDIDITYWGDLVTEVTDATGTWTYDYAVSGNLLTTTVEGPDSQELVVVTDLTVGRAGTVTDALNNSWSYQYAAGRLTRATNPEGDYTEYAYDGRGNVVEITSVPKPGSALSSVTTEITYPAGCTTPYTNVNCNLPLSVEDARGNVTTYEWSATHGGLLSVTAPAVGGVNAQTRTAYAAHHAWYKNSSGVIVAAPTAITLPVETSACATADDGVGCDGTADEVLTTVVYGASGVANNLLPTVVGAGSGDGLLTAATTLTYTPDGDVETVDGPLPGAGDTTRYHYDAARQLVGVVGPDPDGGGTLLNRAQRYSYNLKGQPTLVEAGTTPGQSPGDWANFVTLQRALTVYDDWGRPIRAEAQSSGGTAYSVAQTSYDAAGRVDCVAVRMNPAAFGALPPSACTAGTAAGFGPDRIMQYGYDALGRVISTTAGHGSAAPITETVAYSANGLPETLTDGEGNVSVLVYDGFDRTHRLRYPNATGGGTSTTDYEEYGYDAASNLTSYRNRAGQTFTLAYDARNRPTGMVAPMGAPDIDYVYDNLNRTLGVSTPGGQTLTYAWDALSRLTSETGPRGVMAYQYDLGGRRTRITWPDSFYVTYTHDLYGGLKTADENGVTNLIGVYYDDLGRRTTVTRLNGATTLYGYDPVSRLSGLIHDLDGSGHDLTLAFTYNPAGQIISRGVSNGAYVYAPTTGATAYANNGLNQVTTVGGSPVVTSTRGDITALPGAPAYGYDAAGRLITAGSAAYTFDPAGRLYETDGATEVRFQYDGLQLATEYDFAGVARARHIPGAGLDEVLVTYSGSGLSTRTYPIADERGSIIALTNASGAATQINTYDEYGVPAPGNAGRFQYTGQQWLPDAGLYHYRARAYAAGIGRFTGPDPIGYADGANLYGYVGGDPVNSVDPLGLSRIVRRYYICVGPARDSETNEIIGKIINVAEQCTAFARRGFNPNNYVPGGPRSLRYGGYSDGIASHFPGYDQIQPFNGLTQEQVAFAELRNTHINRNGWMVGVALAPVAVPIIAEVGSTAVFTNVIRATRKEIKFGRNFRIALLGNRTGHPVGRWPHYHRRGPIGPDGKTLPGQGIGRHRPWESSRWDQNFWNRF